MVLASFLGLIGVLSLYRASVTEQLSIPGWVLLAVLVLFLALLSLYLLRG